MNTETQTQDTTPVAIAPAAPKRESGAQRKNRLRVKSPMAPQSSVQRGKPKQ